MTKEKRILSYFIGWLVLGLIICFVGITKTNALVIDSSYLGYSTNTNFGVSTGNYISGNSYILVDQSNALNYYVVDICSTLNYGFSISNVSNISGNVSLYKVFQNLGSCNTTNYNGTLSRIYFKINQWDDAGNGNYGITFGSRFNNTTTYYGDNRILNIYTTNEVDNTSEIINNQTNELNNSINNSTNTITGSITDSENNINQNIDDMESAIVDSNKETQDVIKDQFNNCRDSYNLIDKSIGTMTMYKLPKTLPAGTYTISFDNNNVSAGFRLSNTTDTSSNSIAITGLNINGNRQYLTLTTTFESNYISLSTTISPKNIMLVSGNQVKYEAYGEEICTNKLDETNDALNNIGGALTDDSSIDISELEDSIGWLPPGPVDSIINLPLSLFNSLSYNLSNNTCISASLTLPFVNKNIILPCVKSLYEKIGITGTLFQSAGLIASCFILFNYLLNLYHWVDNTLTLRENTMPGYYDDNWGGGA